MTSCVPAAQQVNIQHRWCLWTTDLKAADLAIQTWHQICPKSYAKIQIEIPTFEVNIRGPIWLLSSLFLTLLSTCLPPILLMLQLDFDRHRTLCVPENRIPLKHNIKHLARQLGARKFNVQINDYIPNRQIWRRPTNNGMRLQQDANPLILKPRSSWNRECTSKILWPNISLFIS